MLLDINDLLGKPYKIHGRGQDGYDCYGLVIEIEKRLGRFLPDLYDTVNKMSDVRNVTLATAMAGLTRTDKPDFGDIIVFRKKGKIDHIAVYLKNGDFIHCDFNGVEILNLNYYDRKGEYYKWQQ